MFQLLFTIAFKFGICLYNVKKYAQQYIKNINKNIFNNFLIAESRRTRTQLFKKLLSPAPAPKSRNAPVLHRCRDILPSLLLRVWLLGLQPWSEIFLLEVQPYSIVFTVLWKRAAHTGEIYAHAAGLLRNKQGDSDACKKILELLLRLISLVDIQVISFFFIFICNSS